jgi:hypothetical protein
MSRAKGATALAVAAALAAAFAGCKATDHAAEQGRAQNARANTARAKANANANANANVAATAGPNGKTAEPAAAAADPHDHGADANVERISIDDARAAVERGEAVFVDVRGDDAFREAHIPGSISIPAGEVAKRVAELPAGKRVITYCA